jgi:phospholipid/cholesterol/gamma-HCH transport system substrate-binding protein
MAMNNPLKGSLRKSFLERNQIIIGLVGIGFVLAFTTGALLMSSGALKKTYSVTAEFSDAAGLKSGDDILVAGLKAGSVDSVKVTGGEVHVILKVDKNISMPRDARAEIVVETLMGKKSVQLSGDASGGPRLHDGDVISLDRTSTPVELLDLANTSVPLLEKSDAEAFNEMLDNISEITRGKRQEVTTLLNGLSLATGAIDDRSQELGRLIESLRTLSTTFAERDDTLVSLIDNLNVVLANLAERQEDVRTLLKSTDSASHETANLVGRNRVMIDGALNNLHDALQILDNHQVDLAAVISYLEDSVRGYASVGYSQGTKNRWANIFVQSLGPLGIDQFFGPCGTFDQALDELLGPDPRPCDERAEYGDQEDGDPEGPTTAMPRQSPEEDDEGLPGDVGDLLGGVLGDEIDPTDADLIDTLRAEL